MDYRRLVRLAGWLMVSVLGARLSPGEVTVAKIFSSHMVLQRDRPIHVWGWSEPGETVAATLNGLSATTVGDRLGVWNVFLRPQPAGGPFVLEVSGQNRVTFQDVLIGDVWFASGQSNMEMPLSGFAGSAVVKNGPEEIRQANHPNIRLFFVPHKASVFPLRDFDSDRTWTVCSPETVAKFSAVAYFFGRELAEKERVPIGLIDSTWGGTPAEAWMSLSGLSADASLMPVFVERAHMVEEQADTARIIAAEKREDAAAKAANLPPARHSWRPDPASWAPSWLFNAMVAPAVNFAIKGVIWYQGESNSVLARAPMYERVFSAMIGDWRKHWHEGNFPFLFTQISSFKSNETENWPVIREAQRRTLSLANTAMAVIIDVGDPENVHPADKQTVGSRLALAARAMAYGETVEYSGPLFREISTDDAGIRVWFDHTEGGLTAQGGALRGFEIAGEDHRFVDGDARIESGSVLVSSAQVAQPKYVRYGWRNAPEVNLFNGSGLPASPFTSEDWNR